MDLLWHSHLMTLVQLPQCSGSSDHSQFMGMIPDLELVSHIWNWSLRFGTGLSYLELVSHICMHTHTFYMHVNIISKLHNY